LAQLGQTSERAREREIRQRAAEHQNAVAHCRLMVSPHGRGVITSVWQFESGVFRLQSSVPFSDTPQAFRAR
jgi:hypothetical protein